MLNKKLYIVMALFVLAGIISFSPAPSFAQRGLLFDDFEDGYANGWLPRTPGNWQVIQNEGDFSYYQSNTNLTGTGQKLNEWSIYNNQTFTNVTFACKAKTAENLGQNPQADYAVIFHYQNDNNYYLAFFNGSQNETVLIKRQNGTETVLNTYGPATIVGNLYQTVSIRTLNGMIDVVADNKTIMRVHDTAFLSGKIGLATQDDAVYFDNIFVTENKASTCDYWDDFNDNIIEGWTAHTPSRWSTNYSWDTDYCLFLNTTDYTGTHDMNLGEFIVIDDLVLENFTFECDLSSNEYTTNQNADLAFVFGYLDENNYYYAMLNRQPGETKLVRWQNSIPYLIDTYPLATLPDQGWYHLKVTRHDGWNEVTFNGVVVLEAYDDYMEVGKIGFGSKNDAGHFDKVCVTYPGCKISVTSPIPGQLWYAGKAYDIIWSSGSTSGNVKIDYSVNNGSSWQNIISSTNDDGHFEWSIPTTVASSNCKIRIGDIQNSACSDDNKGVFTIVGACNITVTAPVGGENWQCGNTYAITWNSTATSGNVKIENYCDGTWETITTNTPDDGLYNWLIPAGTSCDRARIKISDVGDASCNGRSNSFYKIHCCAIQVVSPDGGEVWNERTTHDITWTSENAGDYVRISYSLNAGSSWLPIIDSTPDDGTHSWTLPEVTTTQTQCRVRVESVSNSGCYDVSNGNFTIMDVTCRLTWDCNLSVADAGNNYASLAFGQGPDATNDLDPLCGEAELPPPPMTGVFDARFELPTSTPKAALKDYRNDLLQAATWRIKFQPGTAGYPMTFSWNGASLPAGSFFLQDEVTGTIVSVNMKAQGSYTLTNSGITSLKINYSQQYCRDVSVLNGWNIVSVPVTAANMNVTALFPNATSEAFEFNNGYIAATTLHNGKGYWLKFPGPSTYTICGAIVTPKEIPVNAGWNIIGPLETAIGVAAITTVPAGIIASDFYGYDNGYVLATSLVPGKGYWIKASQTGKLVLPTTVMLTKEVATPGGNAIDRSWPQLSFKDNDGKTATLYLTSAALTDQFELPPVPPAGIFDVRFTSNHYVESMDSKDKQIQINSAKYPVQITVQNLGQQVLTIKDVLGGQMMKEILTDGKAVIITRDLGKIALETPKVPAQLELGQNYPNPFNPTTIIDYSLPGPARIKLAVYNMLGEEVAILVQDDQPAGYHQVQFNARGLAAGIYFYKLEWNGLSAIRKMIILK